METPNNDAQIHQNRARMVLTISAFVLLVMQLLAILVLLKLDDHPKSHLDNNMQTRVSSGLPGIDWAGGLT